MAEWLDIQFHLEGSHIFPALLPLICGFIYYIYRRTHPVGGNLERALLIGLRCAAVGLLLLILAEPVLNLWKKQVVRPLFLLLVDTSTSMATEEEGTRRLDRVAQMLGHQEWGRALEGAVVRAWGFSEEPYSLSLDGLAGLGVGGKATDLSSALTTSLDQVSERDHLRGIILVSDGIHNLGPDPVRTAADIGTPVYALAVGKRENPADIQIVQAGAVGVGYVGQRLNIQAEVHAWGYAGRDVELLLYEGERLIDRQQLALGEESQARRVSFAVRPQAAGAHIYRLSIPPIEGELFRDNNEALVFARVLEERIRVLLMAGGPSPDLAFVQRALAADSNIVVDSRVQKNGALFYQGIGDAEWDLEDRDVVVLLDVGEEFLGGEIAHQIRNRVQEGVGLLFAGGSRTFREWDRSGPLAAVLPVEIERSGRFLSEREIPLQLSPEGRHHPVVRLQAETEGSDPWRQLPPLPGYLPVSQRRQHAISLVEGAEGAHPPIIVAGTSGEGKAIVALSASFWRLDLLSSGVEGRPQTIREFWRNAVKWLAIQTQEGRVRASTSRQIYRSGEQVVFAAQVFDELLRPQEGASVQISLDQKGDEFQLLEQGQGRYRGEWAGLEPGEYAYEVGAYAGETFIGADEGRFIVERHSVESIDVRADLSSLSEMARVSGGRLRPLADWREMLDLLPLQKRLVEEEETLSLWGQNWVLALVVALLALEWILRKRRGMI